jgi:hypothetical protein
MSAKDNREVWLRGPLPNMSPLLQPVAHALLQALEEIEKLMNDFPEDQLWEMPAGVASPGFHLQHLTGVLDRLFTYAKGELLSEGQLQYLSKEGKGSGDISKAMLIENFRNQVYAALEQLRYTAEAELTQVRGVGRAQLPSTVIGLYTHAAEHTMRHLGQLLVTVRILTSS